MKRFLFFVFILLFAVELFAANTDVRRSGTLTVTETNVSVCVKWVVTLASDSSDQHHSEPIFIGDCNNLVDVRAVVSAASDINFFYHFGTGPTWTGTVTATNLDATSNTAKYDELTTTLSFNCADYVVFELDGGGTGANLGEVVTMEAVFTKDDLFLTSGGFVELSRIVTKYPSGWVDP